MIEEEEDGHQPNTTRDEPIITNRQEHPVSQDEKEVDIQHPGDQHPHRNLEESNTASRNHHVPKREDATDTRGPQLDRMTIAADGPHNQSPESGAHPKERVRN